MKSMVIFVVLLIISMPISFARDVAIPEVYETEEVVVGGETTYFYVGSKLLASKNDDVLNYHYQDRLGSDINAKSLPFGQSIKEGDRFSFTGKELDSDLYYFGARYYDSDLGRFVSVDPVPSEPAYQYVGNNPLMFVDPTGTRSDFNYFSGSSPPPKIERDIPGGSVGLGYGGAYTLSMEGSQRYFYDTLSAEFNGVGKTVEEMGNFALAASVVGPMADVALGLVLAKVSVKSSELAVKILYRGHKTPLDEGVPMLSPNARRGGSLTSKNYPELNHNYYPKEANTPELRAAFDHRWGTARLSGDGKSLPGSPYIALTPDKNYAAMYGDFLYQVRIPISEWNARGVDDAFNFLNSNGVFDPTPTSFLGVARVAGTLQESLYGGKISSSWITQIN